MVEDSTSRKPRRPWTISMKGGIALLICFLIGVAAAILLIYTLL
jgi:hypothetical protein